MWLPEAAVDLETLEILAEHGIKFTVLAPRQARRVRPLGGRAWRDVSGGRIDPSMAYRQRLPSRRHIDLFFYDGPISQAVAFEGLLKKGECLAERLAGAFREDRTWPQLTHIATDGETYGHHHRHGDMALAYALHHIESNNRAKLTNYSQFLALHPPTHEVDIFENSSWSCVHGVERWRSNCGCNSGGRPGWDQAWRGPLRAAFDWLRDELSSLYEQKAAEHLKNPWAARDAYIGILHARTPENMEFFIGHHSSRRLEESERVTVLKLLELQRHAMLMYTSCGWFFDELSGIETVQVIHYAGRALQLSQQLFGNDLEPNFVQLLEQARSNIAEHSDGGVIYQKFVKSAMVDLYKVGAHYAVSSMFEPYGGRDRIYCYTVDRIDCQVFSAGKVRLVMGRAKIASEVTLDSDDVTFGVVHLGDHNISGGIRQYRGEEAYQTLVREVADVFTGGDIPGLIRIVDEGFGLGTYSLKLLFHDEQHKILRIILESTLAEALYRGFYESHATLMRFISDMGMPQPQRLKVVAEFVLNTDLRRAFEAVELHPERVHQLLVEARTVGAALDQSSLEFALRQTIGHIADEFARQPEELRRLEALDAAINLARSLPFEVDLWKPQNVYHDVFQDVFPRFRRRMAQAENDAEVWMAHFISLGDKLGVSVPGIEDEKNS